MTAASATHLPAVALLGAGSMGRAILGGLLAPTVDVEGGIRVTGRTAAKLDDLAALGDPRLALFATETDAAANRRAVAGARLVIVAVKPYLVAELLADIADALEPGTIVVSVAAGVTTATFEAALPDAVRVVRTMPNTPAVVGRAVTGLSVGSRATADDAALVRALFETVGSVVEVPESQLDALSTISGSGPAYVFLLIEALTAAAVSKGFTAEQAELLVNETFLGAALQLEASGEEPSELRRRVTSPKGTTEKAIEVLQAASLDELFGRATDAALARAREIAAGA